jgi:hypothetical protein
MILEHFNTLPEFINELREQSRRKYKGDKSAYNSALNNARDTDWTGGLKGFKDGEELLNNGFTPFVDQVANINTAPAALPCFDIAPSVAGQFWDIGTYLQGRPDCMAIFEEQEQPVKFADLVINTAVPVHMTGQELMKRAAAVYTLITQAEAQNIRVSVTIAARVKYANTELLVTIKIKDHADRINPALFGFLIGHAGFTRVYFYSYLSLISTKKTIGSPENYTPAEGETVINLKDMSAEQILNALN